RHTILGGNAQTQMYMVGHGMPLNQFDTHLVAEFPQDLANILAERAKDCFLPIFRYDDNVVSAIPPDMALVLPFSHCGFSFVWPWRVHPGRNHSPLHESTPEAVAYPLELSRDACSAWGRAKPTSGFTSSCPHCWPRCGPSAMP